MNDQTQLALEHVAKQARIVRQAEAMLATALDALGALVTSAQLHGATVQEIAEATGLSDS
jgi:DNA-directed RNA polymerase specialized sigma24 family protein